VLSNVSIAIGFRHRLQSSDKPAFNGPARLGKKTYLPPHLGIALPFLRGMIFNASWVKRPMAGFAYGSYYCRHVMKLKKMKYGFLWVTLVFFLISLVGQWTAGWFEYAAEQKEHAAAIKAGDWAMEMLRGTLENWQSEFLQLCWQVAGLSYLWYLGSPQSKEGEERKEEKIDAILRALKPEEAGKILSEIEQRYPKK
jgi:hypothetical protein